MARSNYRDIQEGRKQLEANTLRKRLLVICEEAVQDSKDWAVSDLSDLDDLQAYIVTIAVERGALLGNVLLELLKNPLSDDGTLKQLLKEWDSK